jgi:hypothetical protein
VCWRPRLFLASNFCFPTLESSFFPIFHPKQQSARDLVFFPCRNQLIVDC